MPNVWLSSPGADFHQPTFTRTVFHLTLQVPFTTFFFDKHYVPIYAAVLRGTYAPNGVALVKARPRGHPYSIIVISLVYITLSTVRCGTENPFTPLHLQSSVEVDRLPPVYF